MSETTESGVPILTMAYKLKALATTVCAGVLVAVVQSES